MDGILDRFSINCHSSIRCGGDRTVRFDPFRVEGAPRDADVVFVTHDHYDHFSPEDLRRVMKPEALSGFAALGAEYGLRVQIGG